MGLIQRILAKNSKDVYEKEKKALIDAVVKAIEGYGDEGISILDEITVQIIYK